MVVDSRTLVKDSARLSLRGVHGVATGVDFKWLLLPQAGVGAELRPLPRPRAHSLPYICSQLNGAWGCFVVLLT